MAVGPQISGVTALAAKKASSSQALGTYLTKDVTSGPGDEILLLSEVPDRLLCWFSLDGHEQSSVPRCRQAESFTMGLTLRVELILGTLGKSQV